MAAVTSAWNAAWKDDMGVWVSWPVRPVQIVRVVPARVPAGTEIRPLRTG
jgi:hypothetical protein